MKRINTSALVPGMIIAEDVFTYSNQMILAKGLVLTDKAITKLEFYSILNVLVENDVAPVKKAAVEDDTPYSQKVKNSTEFKEFKAKFDLEIMSFQKSINSIISKNEPFNADYLYAQATSLIKNENQHISFFDMLHNMRQYDDPTFVHSMNVGLICEVFAGWLKFSEEDIKMATLCGLLHDVGKLMIPESIIKKPYKLTSQEYSIVKTHPKEGYLLMKDINLNEHIINSALMHHERCDGSGYPLGIRGNKIDRFAKIVAIADIYDAMTSARIYRGPLCPFKVIELYENEGLQKYDISYLMVFMENVVNTYMLNRVRLSNGMEGDIIYINRNNLSKPVVKCGSIYVDLSEEYDLFIDSLL